MVASSAPMVLGNAWRRTLHGFFEVYVRRWIHLSSVTSARLLSSKRHRLRLDPEVRGVRERSRPEDFGQADVLATPQLKRC